MWQYKAKALFLVNIPQNSDYVWNKFLNPEGFHIWKNLWNSVLNSMKATRSDKIPFVALKNFYTDVSKILTILFDYCLKEKCFSSLWKLSAACSVFKNIIEHSSSWQYYSINFLSFISKLIESIINKEAHLSGSYLLSKIHFGCCSSKSTIDTFTDITHRICEAFNTSFITTVIALDVKSFWQNVA